MSSHIAPEEGEGEGEKKNMKAVFLFLFFFLSEIQRYDVKALNRKRNIKLPKRKLNLSNLILIPPSHLKT